MRWLDISFIVAGMLIGFLIGAILFATRYKKALAAKLEIEDGARKVLLYYRILVMWLELSFQGKKISTYLLERGYKRIAIYGMKELGECLYKELKSSDVEVAYVIDRNKYILGDYPIYSPDDNLPSVDAIIVTADYYYNEISKSLKSKCDCDIMSIGNIFADGFGIYLY